MTKPDPYRFLREALKVYEAHPRHASLLADVAREAVIAGYRADDVLAWAREVCK